MTHLFLALALFSCCGSMIANTFTPATGTFTPATKADLKNAIDHLKSNHLVSHIYGHISTWNTELITHMSGLFENFTSFNEPIGSWNTASVTSMHHMFDGASAFNQPLGNWNTIHVVNMALMFKDASAFNQPIGAWTTNSVTNMGSMFDGASIFNQPIGAWTTNNVTNMAKMFNHASTFNQPIEAWNTASVTSMHHMFNRAYAFNQPLGLWNTAAVTNMRSMFSRASTFNQPIGTWNTSSVNYMNYMFESAFTFNQPIGGWNTANVDEMWGMFISAISLCQNITSWNGAPAYAAAFISMPIPRWPFCQATTSSSKATTTTTSFTTLAFSSVEGSITLQITNRTQFINEPNLTSVIAMVVATLLEVNLSWVQNITVTPVLVDRRLLLHIDHNRASVANLRGRVLTGAPSDFVFTTKTGVRVNFRVKIPPDGMAQATANVIADRFNALTLEEASGVVNSILRSGFLGQHYISRVTHKIAFAPQSRVEQEPKKNTGRATIFIAALLSALSGFISFLLVYSFWLARKKRRDQIALLLAGDVDTWSVSEFLCIPDVISTWRKVEIDTACANLFAEAEAEVYLTFALGSRKSDAQNAGPGLFYAAAACKALLANGVSCRANLRHVDSAVRQEDGADLMIDPTSRIKVLIVVETLALFQSERCLCELFAALESNTEVIRLRFEGIPDDYERWSQINSITGNICYQLGPRTFSLEVMKKSVLQKLDVLSAPPLPVIIQGNIQQKKHVLEDIAVRIQTRLMGGHQSSLKVISRGTTSALDAGEHADWSSIQAIAQGAQLEIPIVCQSNTSEEEAMTAKVSATCAEGGARPRETSREHGQTKNRVRKLHCEKRTSARGEHASRHDQRQANKLIKKQQNSLACSPSACTTKVGSGKRNKKAINRLQSTSACTAKASSGKNTEKRRPSRVHSTSACTIGPGTGNQAQQNIGTRLRARRDDDDKTVNGIPSARSQKCKSPAGENATTTPGLKQAKLEVRPKVIDHVSSDIQVSGGIHSTHADSIEPHPIGNTYPTSSIKPRARDKKQGKIAPASVKSKHGDGKKDNTSNARIGDPVAVEDSLTTNNASQGSKNHKRN